MRADTQVRPYEFPARRTGRGAASGTGAMNRAQTRFVRHAAAGDAGGEGYTTASPTRISPPSTIVARRPPRPARSRMTPR